MCLFPREVLFVYFVLPVHITYILHFALHSSLQGTLLSLRFGFRSLGLSFIF